MIFSTRCTRSSRFDASECAEALLAFAAEHPDRDSRRALRAAAERLTRGGVAESSSREIRDPLESALILGCRAGRSAVAVAELFGVEVSNSLRKEVLRGLFHRSLLRWGFVAATLWTCLNVNSALAKIYADFGVDLNPHVHRILYVSKFLSSTDLPGLGALLLASSLVLWAASRRSSPLGPIETPLAPGVRDTALGYSERARLCGIAAFTRECDKSDREDEDSKSTAVFRLAGELHDRRFAEAAAFRCVIENSAAFVIVVTALLSSAACCSWILTTSMKLSG